jgi:CRP/FNR family transcriptional regulator, cyclic AMP receptor protein
MRRRSRDPKVGRLGKVQLFSACSRADLERISALTNEIDVSAGTVLIREGDPGRECFVIEAGTARVELAGGATASMGPGEVFGELALLDQAPRSATVTAESDMRVLVLNSREFSTLIDDHPSVRRNVLAAVASRIRQAEEPAPSH